MAVRREVDVDGTPEEVFEAPTRVIVTESAPVLPLARLAASFALVLV